MKKIIILNGSGKKNGNTAAVIKAFSEGAASNGSEVTEFFLQNMNIHGCLDCQGCRRKGEEDPCPCVQKDDMALIYPAFKEADVIVFASPVYWWDITGTLKTAIDRLYALGAYFRTKPAKETVLLMTSGGSPIDHMSEWYQEFENWFGWKSLGEAMNDPEKARAIGAGIN